MSKKTEMVKMIKSKKYSHSAISELLDVDLETVRSIATPYRRAKKESLKARKELDKLCNEFKKDTQPAYHLPETKTAVRRPSTISILALIIAVITALALILMEVGNGNR